MFKKGKRKSQWKELQRKRMDKQERKGKSRVASPEDGSSEVSRERRGQEREEPLALDLIKPAIYQPHTKLME